MLQHTETPEPATPSSFRAEEAESLVARLRRGFASGRTRPVEWRRRQLRALRAMLVEREASFHEALHADLRKSEHESFLTETGFTVGEIDHALKHLSSWVKPEKVHTPLAVGPGRSTIRHDPLGVVLVIAPWNYPLSLTLIPQVAALAAGNCTVLKPSEIAPHTAAAIAEWVPKYLDAECTSVVLGGVEVSQALLAQRFDHIFYTGSGSVGRIVMEAAAKHLTPVTLELGGKSPAVVDREADVQITARRLAWGKFFNAGQTCVAPDYVLVDESLEQPLMEAVRDTIVRFYGADPRQSPDYARIVNERHFARLQGMLSEGEVVVGGEADAAERYIAPTVVRGVPPEARLLQDEIFGPILPIVSVPNIDVAIERINAGPAPLALYVFTRDKAIAERVIEQTRSGGACINDTLVHLSVPDLPFGGVGPSGMGAYHGRAGFETFSHRRSVLDKGTLVDPPVRYPPYTAQKLKWIRRLT